MTAKSKAAAALSRAKVRAQQARAQLAGSGTPVTGHAQLRLVDSPVFVLSSVRSGSTLLRVILNSHSQVCAPHELHMRTVKVELSRNAEVAMKAAGFAQRDLENLLWDRMLDLSLGSSGKSIIVDKTPSNTFAWKRLDRVWPNARYIFLFRHPVRVLESMVAAWPNTDLDANYVQINNYAQTLYEAREKLGGLTVRYEDLTNRPEATARQLCSWLGVDWEPAMLDYLNHDQGNFAARLGDWHDTIKSGVIRASAPDPSDDDIPDQLKDAARSLGYL